MNTPSLEKPAITERKPQLDIMYGMEDFGDDIHRACFMDSGIKAWFGAYLLSREYQALISQFKADAFDTYAELSDYLNTIVNNEDSTNKGFTGNRSQSDIETSELFFAMITQQHAAGLHQAHAMSYGLAEWFKAFIISDEYTKISSDTKGEAFVTYTNLSDFLEQIEKNQFCRN